MTHSAGIHGYTFSFKILSFASHIARMIRIAPLHPKPWTRISAFCRGNGHRIFQRRLFYIKRKTTALYGGLSIGGELGI